MCGPIPATGERIWEEWNERCLILKNRRKRTDRFLFAILILIAAAGILGTGYIRGWFDPLVGGRAALIEVKGVVSITRSGFTFPAGRHGKLRNGDVITCVNGGTALVDAGGGSTVALGDHTRILVSDAACGSFGADVEYGDVFACSAVESAAAGDTAPQRIRLAFDEGSILVEDAVASVSARTGSRRINVYAGTAGSLHGGDSEIHVTGGKTSIGEIDTDSLDAFLIRQLQKSAVAGDLCFTAEELAAIAAADQNTAAGADALPAAPDQIYECTVSVECLSALQHPDWMNPVKTEFIPDDGWILRSVRVPFSEKETAFDATKRALEYAGIPMEYSWTPLYNSFYLEGIGHLYELDGGPESGWLYRINGWYPGSGASSCVLQDGDEIRWTYSCTGMEV